MIKYRLALSDLDEIIENSSEDLASLSERQIVVTGGSGFVGSWIVETLVRAIDAGLLKGTDLSVINRTKSPIQSEWAESGFIKIIESDIRSLAPKSLRADLVFHCATPASDRLNRQRPEEMFDIIVNGCRTFLDSLVDPNARFVNLSSGAVYGAQGMSVSKLDEETSLATEISSLSAYAKGKIQVETMLNHLVGETELEILHARLFAFIAPLLPLDTHFAAGNFIGQAIRQASIVVSGEPSTVRSYQYGTDLVRALLRIAARGRSGESFNVGSEEEVTVGDLAVKVQSLASQYGMKSEIQFEWDGSGATRYVPSVKKLEQRLGFRNNVSLNEAIQRTLAWYAK